MKLNKITVVMVAGLFVMSQAGAVEAGTFVSPHWSNSNVPAFAPDSPVGAHSSFFGIETGPGGGSALIELFGDGGQRLLSPFGVPLGPVELIAGPNEFAGTSIDEIFGELGVAPGNLSGYAVINTSGDVTGVFNDFAYNSGAQGVQFLNTNVAPLGNASGGTFVFPHLLEQSGDILTATNTFDTQIYVTYLADQAGVPSGSGTATSVDIFLFDELTGDLLQNDLGSAICDPCSFPMGTDNPGSSFDGSDTDTSISPRKRKIAVDALIKDNNGGNFLSSGIFLGFAEIVVNGDSDLVNITGFTGEVQNGPAALSVFVFEPQEIAAAAILEAGDPLSVEGGTLITYTGLELHNVEIPEPSSLLLLGLCGMFGMSRRRMS